MAVRFIEIESDALLVCIVHALTTEREEIMGLLIGYTTPDSVCHVVSLLSLRRIDKRPDRVEISDQQLVEASDYCEKLSVSERRNLRVVGWYHSHPHITIWPSHVDIRTQKSYQTMDPNYVGIIVSVFNKERYTHATKAEVIGFQAGSNNDKVVIPVHVMRSRLSGSRAVLAPVGMSTHCLRALCSLPRLFAEEETMSYERALDQLDIQRLPGPLASATPAAAGSDCDPYLMLHKIQCGAVLEQWLCELHSRITIPLLTALHVRITAMHAERVELQRRKERLQNTLDEERRRLALLEQQQSQADTGSAGAAKNASTESNGAGADLLADADAEFLPAANEHIDSAANGSAFRMKF